jgi:hypothetical protein
MVYEVRGGPMFDDPELVNFSRVAIQLSAIGQELARESAQFSELLLTAAR